MNKENNWFKLFALLAVGSVAKTLFGPPPAPRVTVNQAVEAVEKLKGNDDKDN